MKSTKNTPEARFSLGILPQEAFRSMSEKEAYPTDSVRVQTTADQFRDMQYLAGALDVNIMDVVRGAVRPYLTMLSDKNEYYDVPLLDALPEGKKVSFTGRLGTAQLWQLTRLSGGYSSKAAVARRNRLLYSANQLFLQRTFENTGTAEAFAAQVAHMRPVIPFTGVYNE